LSCGLVFDETKTFFDEGLDQQGVVQAGHEMRGAKMRPG
jgi:hypothetical protein